VNAVAPGIAIFPESYEQELREKLIRSVPLQRAGSPEEIAAIVRFLVTTADYVTGQVIAIDGGRSIVP
jgi:pteridine reductase